MPSRGLIVGKFYPPHRGHKHLIDSARSQVDSLTVIVCQKPGENPEGELRYAWLREIHPDVEFVLIDDTYDENDSRVWAENSIRWLGGRPDVVFASESYVYPFSEHLGCRPVLVDIERTTVPISGTRVRNDPFGNWVYLEPPVRAHYALRICLVGAESTGKTTLAQALAKHYETEWAPEFGREYSERMLAEKGCYEFTSSDFTEIARTQCEMEEAGARRANRLLICDTDAFATSIWHRRYMGDRSPEVEAIVARHRTPDLYFLTDINTPFEQDGTRDGEAIRDWMHRVFVEELTTQNRPYVEIAGTHEERMRTAVHYIDAIIDPRPKWKSV